MPLARLEPAISGIKRLQTTAIEPHDYLDEPANDLGTSDFSNHTFSSRSPRHTDSSLKEFFNLIFLTSNQKEHNLQANGMITQSTLRYHVLQLRGRVFIQRCQFRRLASLPVFKV